MIDLSRPFIGLTVTQQIFMLIHLKPVIDSHLQRSRVVARRWLAAIRMEYR
jgi:hypothetical protein